MQRHLPTWTDVHPGQGDESSSGPAAGPALYTHTHPCVPRGVLEAVNAPGGAREDLVEVAPGWPGRAQASGPFTPC